MLTPEAASSTRATGLGRSVTLPAPGAGVGEYVGYALGKKFGRINGQV